MSDSSSARPYSDKLADLHVFIVPVELFLDKYRTAFNNIALESVSAGFVRVPPNDTMYELRDHIEDQLGFDIVPEDFVYLRSVGRCMAVVRENQERILKIKDFLPPVAYTPEIFLLPATHDTIARPASDASTVVISTQGHTTAGLNSVQPQTVHLPNIQQQYPGKPQLVTQQYDEVQQVTKNDSINSGYSYQGEISDNEPYHQFSDGERSQQHSLQSSLRSSYDDGQMPLKQKEANKVKTVRQDSVDENAEVKVKRKNKRHRTQKKHSLESSDGTSVESGQEISSKTKQTRSVKFIQPEVAPALPVVSPDESYVSLPTPLPSGHVISPSPAAKQVEQNKQQDISGEQDDKSHDLSIKTEGKNAKPEKQSKSNKKKNKVRSKSPTTEQLKNVYNSKDADNGLMLDGTDIENVKDRSKYCQFPSPLKGVHQAADENEMSSGIAEDYSSNLYNGDELNGIDEEFPSDTTDEQSNDFAVRDQDERNMEGVNIEEINKLEGDKLTSNGQLVTTNGLAEENEKLQDGDKNSSDEKVKTKKKNRPKKTQREVEDIEEKFAIPKVLTPPPIELPSKAREELEKDSASDRDRKQQEVEKLRGELRRSKHERAEFEKQREQLVRRAKNIQSQTLQKRTQAQNIWKKRFFDEKRKTQPLEEQVNRLRYEVDVQHKALMSFLDKKNQEGSTQPGLHNTPSENTNQRMMLVRLQHEVEELRRRVEETKMKLASEMKMRDQAQNELKQLRKDLMEKKINVTLNRNSQKSLQSLINPENIKV